MRGMRTLGLACCVVVLLSSCNKHVPPAEPAPVAAAPTADPRALEAQIQKALELRAARKQDEGIALLEKTRLQALEGHQPALATLALNRRGDLANDLGRKKEAAQDYELAYSEAEARSDFAAMGRAAHDRALLQSDVWGAGEPGALEWYPKAVEARRKAKDLVGVRRSANNLAIQFFYASKKDEALRWFNEALEAGEAAEDWDGVYRIHANLALLWAVAAEGAFAPGAPLRAWVPPLKLEPEAEAKAREAFAKGIEAAKKIGRSEDDVCGVLGNYGARCLRLTPGATSANGLPAFFAQLALEAESSSFSIPEEQQLQAALLCLRAADAAQSADAELKKQVPLFEQTARDHFAEAAKAAGSQDMLCKDTRAEELCTRFKAAPVKKAKAPVKGK
jgi:tetratricopeptide (TPR) repeat protein